MERKTKANWWIPFSFVPLMIVAILLESHLTYATAIHEIVDSGIVIVMFGSMLLWVRLNSDKLMEEDSAEEHWVFMEEPCEDEDGETEFPSDFIPEPTHEPLTQHAHSVIGLRAIDSNKGRYN